LVSEEFRGTSNLWAMQVLYRFFFSNGKLKG
jgi:hypothetical protein